MFCDTKINIRQAQTSDTPAINALLSQIVQVHHGIRPDIFRQSYKNEDANFGAEEADALVFVAINEDECVVGCLWCLISHERNNSLKINRDWLVIDDICVDEKYRGNGIGTILVDFAWKLALEKGLDKIELNVYEDNRNAVRFYKHLGFKTQKRVMELNIPTLISLDKETDEERQARIYPIILSEYNPAWTRWFVEEKINLGRLIGKDNIARISHYGSRYLSR